MPLRKFAVDRHLISVFVCLTLGWTASSSSALTPDDSDESSARAWYWRGTKSLEERRYGLAIDDFSKSLRKIDVIKFGEFDSAARLAASAKSLDDIENITNLNYMVALCYNWRGTAYGCLGDCKSAIKDFDKALKAYPQFGKALSNRGNANMILEHFDKALKDFNHATMVSPELPEPYKNRATIYRKMKRPKLEKKELAALKKMPPPPLDYESSFHTYKFRFVRKALSINPRNAYLLKARDASGEKLKRFTGG